MPFRDLSLYYPALKLPKIIRTFLLKLICLATIWELSYHLILKPARVPDKILTDFITAGVTTCINFFFDTISPSTWVSAVKDPANYIQQGGKNIFSIYDFCNGLDLIVIYLGFIILLPYSVKRKIAFSLGGIAALIILNIIRCVLLYWIYYNYRGIFEINHHYIFTIVMYLLIFFGWILFTKRKMA